LRRGAVLNTIIHGDCLEVMADIPGGSIDCTITDPPYGIGYEYTSYDDTIENLMFITEHIFPEIIRVSKRVVTFCGVQNVWLYPQADWIMSYSWNTTAKYGKYGYNQWQPILLYGKDIKGFGSVNGVLKSDSVKFSGGAGIGFLADYKDKNHPCPKPLNVMELLVRRFTNECETVLDPFIGSGTTAIACINTGRNYIGIEKDKGYYDIACKRIADHERQLSIV
jgi:site-specific DNA-methyltransferase (adenine-specific)